MAGRPSKASVRLAGRSCLKSLAERPSRRRHPQKRFRPSPQRRTEFSPMSQELAYVIITPYTLHKSRTGGILSRLITRTGLELVGARMFAPSAALVKKYSEAIVSANDPH